MTSVGEDVEILEPSYTAGGMESGAVAVATSLVVPRSVKYRVITCPSSSHLRICPRELKTCVIQKPVGTFSQKQYP